MRQSGGIPHTEITVRRSNGVIHDALLRQAGLGPQRASGGIDKVSIVL